MKYISTRGSAPALDFESVVLAGLASDGGLYVPEAIPSVTMPEKNADALIDKLVRLAMADRPGPVHIDLPIAVRVDGVGSISTNFDDVRDPVAVAIGNDAGW